MLKYFLRLILVFSLLIWFDSSVFSQDKLILDLDQSLETAYQNNRALQSQKEKISSARFKISEAKSNFYPQLSFQGSYTYLGVLPSFIVSFPPIIENEKITQGYHDNFNFALSLQQSIFTWGRLQNNYSISRLNLQSEEETYNKDKQNITYEVKSSFYSALLVRELIRVRKEALKNIEEHLKTVELRYKAGQASEFDLLRTKVQLANAKPPLLQTEQAYDLALSSFKNILGLSQELEIELEGELLFDPVEVELGKATQEALSRRSELESLDIRKKIAQKGLALARAGNKPSLLGIANYSYQNPFYGEKKWDADWNFTLSLNFPLFDGFATRSRINQSKSDLNQLDIGEKDLKEGIKLEVKDAVTSLNLARETILSQEENVKQAKESLRIARIQYAQGMITSLEEMDTELALTYAQVNYLQALTDYLIAQAKYNKAIGEKLSQF
ncbi:MAG: TolC family protein [candidate division Zixibacteria bacterium]|nr:TolC family protein [candidate division Zixibacteria bacterium]